MTTRISSNMCAGYAAQQLIKTKCRYPYKPRHRAVNKQIQRQQRTNRNEDKKTHKQNRWRAIKTIKVNIIAKCGTNKRSKEWERLKSRSKRDQPQLSLTTAAAATKSNNKKSFVFVHKAHYKSFYVFLFNELCSFLLLFLLCSYKYIFLVCSLSFLYLSYIRSDCSLFFLFKRLAYAAHTANGFRECTFMYLLQLSQYKFVLILLSRCSFSFRYEITSQTRIYTRPWKTGCFERHF